MAISKAAPSSAAPESKSRLQSGCRVEDKLAQVHSGHRLPPGRSHYRHFRKIFNGILILKSLKMAKTKDLLVSGGVFWLPADSRVPSSADSGRLWSPLFPSAAEREKSSGIIFLLIRFVRSFHFNNSLLWLVL